MAESIYTQLENGKAITPVDGKDYNATLSANLFPTAEQFESPEKLVAWAKENDFTAKLIQKGLQKAIIEVRACFKSFPKDKVWTEKMGIANLDKLEWKSVDRPNIGGAKKVDEARFNDCMALIATMTANKMTPEQIRPMLIATYDEVLVDGIFASLTK